MKRILPAFALIAALSVTGCSGNDSKSDQGHDSEDDSSSQDKAEQAPEMKQLDEDQLKKIIESTDADGTSFKYVDISGASDTDVSKLFKDAEFKPAKCKNLAMAAFDASQQGEGNTAAGSSSDNTQTVSLVSLKDADAAESQLKNSSSLTDACSNVSIKTQGMEMKMSHKQFDTTVAGADETLGLHASIDSGSQSTLESDMITSRVGNNLIIAANLGGSVDKKATAKTAETFVDAVANAG